LTEARLAALVAALAAVPALLALAIFGVIETNDSPGYLLYAEALKAGPLPSGEALLRSGPAPVTIYRTIGFPALLVLLDALPGPRFAGLVALQIAAQSAIAAACFLMARRLSLPRGLAAAAALAPATGYAAYVQITVMTDPLYGALATGAALVLLAAALSGGRLAAILLAGLMLAVATTIREATPYLALAALPAALLAAPRGRRWAAPLLLLAPLAVTALAMAQWHAARSGHAVLSTSRQIVMVQALLPLVRERVPVFHDDTPFDRAARETLLPHGYAGIDALNARLFSEGYTAPEIAAMASARYWRAWREHPLAMIEGAVERFPNKMLAIAFQPFDTAAEFERQLGQPRPWFTRLDVIWRELRGGSVLAGLVLLGLALSRAIGTALGLAAIAAPLLLARDDPRWLPLLGAWLWAGGQVAVYLPVHLEIRYLVPIAPILALLAAAALHAAWARRGATASARA
jgi:hypothetical protein